MIERERGPVKFEIIRHIGVLNSYPTGWSKEFNIVRWNDKSDKFDVRDWAPGHERMSRGVTMFEEELKKLMELCSGLFNEESAAETDYAQQSAEESSVQIDMTSADKVAEEEVPF